MASAVRAGAPAALRAPRGRARAGAGPRPRAPGRRGSAPTSAAIRSGRRGSLDQLGDGLRAVSRVGEDVRHRDVRHPHEELAEEVADRGDPVDDDHRDSREEPLDRRRPRRHDEDVRGGEEREVRPRDDGPARERLARDLPEEALGDRVGPHEDDVEVAPPGGRGSPPRRAGAGGASGSRPRASPASGRRGAGPPAEAGAGAASSRAASSTSGCPTHVTRCAEAARVVPAFLEAGRGSGCRGRVARGSSPARSATPRPGARRRRRRGSRPSRAAARAGGGSRASRSGRPRRPSPRPRRFVSSRIRRRANRIFANASTRPTMARSFWWARSRIPCAAQPVSRRVRTASRSGTRSFSAARSAAACWSPETSPAERRRRTPSPPPDERHRPRDGERAADDRDPHPGEEPPARGRLVAPEEGEEGREDRRRGGRGGGSGRRAAAASRLPPSRDVPRVEREEDVHDARRRSGTSSPTSNEGDRGLAASRARRPGRGGSATTTAWVADVVRKAPKRRDGNEPSVPPRARPTANAVPTRAK